MSQGSATRLREHVKAGRYARARGKTDHCMVGLEVESRIEGLQKNIRAVKRGTKGRTVAGRQQVEGIGWAK